MSATDAEVRNHLAALARANAFEVEELRAASIELKLRQLWTLMMSAHLFESPEEREIAECAARERWSRLYQALDA